jgi:hypothetical protein
VFQPCRQILHTAFQLHLFGGSMSFDPRALAQESAPCAEIAALAGPSSAGRDLVSFDPRISRLAFSRCIPPSNPNMQPRRANPLRSVLGDRTRVRAAAPDCS